MGLLVCLHILNSEKGQARFFNGLAEISTPNFDFIYGGIPDADMGVFRFLFFFFLFSLRISLDGVVFS